MNTKILEYIIAIAQEKSISKAADHYYLSQPVMSRHLKNIESEFGCTLFDRKNGMSLTREGVIFINNAQNILYIQSELEKELHTMKRQQKNCLRLLIDGPYYNFFVRGVLPKFQEKYPNFKIEFFSTNVVQAQKALREGKADFALFSSMQSTSKKLEYLSLFSDELMPVLSPDCDDIHTSNELRKALEHDLAFILHPLGFTFRMFEDNHLNKLNFHPKTIIECANFHGMFDMLSEMRSCAYIPKSILGIHREIRPFSLESSCDFHLVIAYSRKKPFHTPAQELLSIMIGEYSEFFGVMINRF